MSDKPFPYEDINHLMTAPETGCGEWIPVEKRLPDTQLRVLITHPSSRRIYIGSYHANNGLWFSAEYEKDGWFDLGEIRAWRPLPAPHTLKASAVANVHCNSCGVDYVAAQSHVCPATTWNIASNSKKNDMAADAGLIRPSSFDRDLPCWHELPKEWKDKLTAENGSASDAT